MQCKVNGVVAESEGCVKTDARAHAFPSASHRFTSDSDINQVTRVGERQSEKA